MKEIERLSIGGYAFTLEKDAAAEVEQYLRDLEAHYLGQQGGKEIMEGIEERMAELLLEKCGQGRVASLVDIRAIIDILGRPERIEADDPQPEKAPEKTRRKMYRDLENKTIGGVCAGLSAYLDVDVALIRILFVAVSLVLFFTGARHGVWSMAGFAAYVILWVAMPAARTAQERWAMKGDSGTLGDIQRNVRAGVREIGDAARKGAREVGDAVRSQKGHELGRIILIALGIFLLLSGVSGLTSVSVIGIKGPALLSTEIDRFLTKLSFDWPVFYGFASSHWFIVLVVLAIVLPLLELIYLGLRFIFGVKAPSWKPGLVILVLWLVVVAILAALFFFGAFSTEYLHA